VTVPSRPRQKILFIAEGVTLAHVGRALRLASIIHDQGFEVAFACDARYGRFLAGAPFAVSSIPSLSPDVFMEALRRGKPVFTQPVLQAEVRDDLEILERIRPDAVVGDFRLSLSTSARVAGIPYANVTNAYWSPYAHPRFVMPSLPLARGLNASLADALFNVARPIAFALHSRPFNAVRRAHGLPALPLDVRHAYCDGDVTLYADAPGLIPTRHIASSHHYIGPVLWSPRVERPAWWHEATAGAEPIYLSLGSSGAAGLLGSIIDALATVGRPVVVATAGRIAGRASWPAGVYAADFVPGDEISARACVVVCNGGSLTAQQALLNGVPVVGIASNLDQHLNMGYVEQAGAGVLLRADRVSAAAVRETVSRVIVDAVLRAGAARARASLEAIRSEIEFPAALRRLLGATR
jgi:UDP:flavonoid glycosyltransferase YjiC (YdhE family)